MTAMITVVGNPKPHSRTLEVARRFSLGLREALVEAGRPMDEPRVIDLVDYTADLLGQGGRPGALDDALTGVRQPGGLVVVASPTFKGAYSGLLKMFMDLLPQRGLRGTVAVPLMTAASTRHRAVVGHYLGPLLLELGARVPGSGLCVLEAEFDDLDRHIDGWLRHGLPAVIEALRIPHETAGPG
ncbi:NAD(P)H-dependent oxidoreductase [Nonomuraea purpurea]|uniref:NAD(P)H-dependent oxidoreductase n=1 Tax=Nonomuraea purpurea TaxID=1849276 RepID=A0ABV8GJJ7_9ACTN